MDYNDVYHIFLMFQADSVSHPDKIPSVIVSFRFERQYPPIEM